MSKPGEAPMTLEECKKGIRHFLDTDKLMSTKVRASKREAIAALTAGWVMNRSDVLTGHTKGQAIVKSACRVLEQLYIAYRGIGIEETSLSELLDTTYKSGSPLTALMTKAGPIAKGSGSRGVE